MKIRKMRSISQVIKFIKENDKETAITRYFIENLIYKQKIYYIKSGNKYYVDLDEVLNKLGK